MKCRHRLLLAGVLQSRAHIDQPLSDIHRLAIRLGNQWCVYLARLDLLAK